MFVARERRHELTPVVLTRAQVAELVERMLKSSGRRVDVSQPFVDAMLPGGHRLHVVLEGITRGFSAVNIRKFVVKAAQLEDLVGAGSLTTDAARFLRACVVAGLNILVVGRHAGGQDHDAERAGRRDPGRTAGHQRRGGLRARLPAPRLGADADPAERAGGHRRGLAARPGQGDPCGCGPSRIIIGEVRAEECLDLLLALNAGLPGMASLHANSAREALVKMCTLPLLAGENTKKGTSYKLGGRWQAETLYLRPRELGPASCAGRA